MRRADGIQTVEKRSLYELQEISRMPRRAEGRRKRDRAAQGNRRTMPGVQRRQTDRTGWALRPFHRMLELPGVQKRDKGAPHRGDMCDVRFTHDGGDENNSREMFK